MRPTRPKPIWPTRTRSFAPTIWEWERADMATAVAPSAVVLTNSRRETGVFIKLLGGPASIDRDCCARDVTGGVGGEENDEAVDFVHLAPTAHWDFGNEGLVGFGI